MSEHYYLKREILLPAWQYNGELIAEAIAFKINLRYNSPSFLIATDKHILDGKIDIDCLFF